MIRKVSRTRRGEDRCKKHHWVFRSQVRVFRGKQGQVRGLVSEYRCTECGARGEDFRRD